MSKKLYGWFSQIQLNNNKESFCYLNTENNEVWVTQVKSEKTPINFNDAVYIGEVTKFVKSYKSNASFDNKVNIK